jgi:hypothetical protein
MSVLPEGQGVPGYGIPMQTEMAIGMALDPTEPGMGLDMEGANLWWDRSFETIEMDPFRLLPEGYLGGEEVYFVPPG